MYLAIVRDKIIQRKPIMCNDKVDTVVWLSLIHLSSKKKKRKREKNDSNKLIKQKCVRFAWINYLLCKLKPDIDLQSQKCELQKNLSCRNLPKLEFPYIVEVRYIKILQKNCNRK